MPRELLKGGVEHRLEVSEVRGVDGDLGGEDDLRLVDRGCIFARKLASFFATPWSCDRPSRSDAGGDCGDPAHDADEEKRSTHDRADIVGAGGDLV